jgi:hypothetical protein
MHGSRPSRFASRPPSIAAARGIRYGRLILPLLVASVAAGCGGSGKTTTPASSAPAVTTGTVPAGTVPAGTAGSSKSCPRLPPNPDQAAEFGLSDCEVERRQVKVENLIQVCMKGQGFDYVPVDPATLKLAMDSGAAPAGVSEKDFPKLYGYGLATLYAQSLNNAAKTRGQPNEKIRASLRPADQSAYDHALYGNNAGATFAVALGKEDPTMLGGCTKQAFDAVFPANEVAQLRKTGQDAITQRALQDPRLISATRAWSSCMRAAGFNYSKPDDAKADIQTKLTAITGRAAASGTPGAPYDTAALAALGKDELNVARADAACQTKTAYSATKTKVEAEVAKKLGH